MKNIEIDYLKEDGTYEKLIFECHGLLQVKVKDFCYISVKESNSRKLEVCVLIDSLTDMQTRFLNPASWQGEIVKKEK
jgi:hypothetical protein